MPKPKQVKNIAVFVSGSGTLLEHMIKHKLPIALVLADRPCRGIEIAQAAGLETVIVYRKEFGWHPGAKDRWKRDEFTEAVDFQLMMHKIDLVAMAGFMTILSRSIFISYWFINSHPALLPLFPGATAVKDALEARAVESGTTIHLATEIMDDPSFIIAQKKLLLDYDPSPDERVASNWERIKEIERPLYFKVLQDILAGEINLEELFTANQ